MLIYHFEIENRSYYFLLKIILNTPTCLNVTLVPNVIFIKHKIWLNIVLFF